MDFLSYVRANWDRVGAVVSALGGLIALIAGYAGTADTEYVAKQLPYMISGGLTGIFLLGVAAVLWLSADLRDEWRQMRQLSESIRLEQELRRQELQQFVAEGRRPSLRHSGNGDVETANASFDGVLSP